MVRQAVSRQDEDLGIDGPLLVPSELDRYPCLSGPCVFDNTFDIEPSVSRAPLQASGYPVTVACRITRHRCKASERGTMTRKANDVDPQGASSSQSGAWPS
jgi:hypothetical protein